MAIFCPNCKKDIFAIAEYNKRYNHKPGDDRYISEDDMENVAKKNYKIDRREIKQIKRRTGKQISYTFTCRYCGWVFDPQTILEEFL